MHNDETNTDRFPSLVKTMLWGWHCGLVLGLIIGLQEGFRSLFTTRTVWSMITGWGGLFEMLRWYAVPVWAEALTVSLLALPLTLLVWMIRRYVIRPILTRRSGDDLRALVAGVLTALFFYLFSVSFVLLFPKVRLVFGAVSPWFYLRALIVWGLVGTAAGLYFRSGRRGPVTERLGAWFGALAPLIVLCCPFILYVMESPVRQRMGSSITLSAAALIGLAGAAAAIFLFVRLRRAQFQSEGPGRLFLWLIYGSVLAGLLLSLPGWILYRSAESSPPGTAGHRDPDLNVILVTVDTLRGDRLRPDNPSRPLTPHLDRLIKRGVFFTQAESQSPWTLPSVASMMTSLYPTAHGASTPRAKLNHSLVTLADALSEAGLFTKAVVANGWLNYPFGINQGFDNYEYVPSHRPGPRWWPGLFSRQMLSWLGFGQSPHAEKTELALAANLIERSVRFIHENSENNFFLWVHLVDPHDPYVARDAFRQIAPAGAGQTNFSRFTSGPVIDFRKGAMVPPREKQRLERLYDLEVRYSDEQIGRLLKAVRSLKLHRNTMIIFTSDHGEEFWEHGNVIHGHNLYTEQLNVPLILRLPDGETVSRRIETNVVRLLDVAPTILDFLGLEQPGEWEGRSLLPLVRGDEEPADRINFSEALIYYQEMKAVRRNPYKYIHSEETGEEELYDLENDPGELENLVRQQPELAAELRDLLRAHLEEQEELAIRLIPDSAEEFRVDESHLEELRALGYIQ